MRRGRGSTVAAVLLCCSLTAACGPREVTTLAVFLEGDTPAVLLRPCDGDVVHGVSVQEYVTLPGATSATFSREWAVSNPRPEDARDVLRLLQTPPGWAPAPDQADLLTDFREDASYGAWAETRPGDSVDNVIRFTLGDLRSLSGGQVWATPDPYESSRAMTRDEFAEAAASC